MTELDTQYVAAKIRQEHQLLERLVEDFFNQHPLLGFDDVEIVCIVAPNGIDRTYQVREVSND